MAVFGYGRSIARGQSTENQRLEIEAAGYRVDRWITDEGRSGKTDMQRRHFVAMLEEMKRGDRLVVTRLGHLGDDAADVLRTIQALAERNMEVVVLQLGKLDLGSAAATPMRTMLAAVADMECERTEERARSGSTRVKTERTPPGRSSSRPTSEQRTKIVTEYSMGCSVSELARRYNVSRASILGIVTPKSVPPAPLPLAWGD